MKSHLLRTCSVVLLACMILSISPLAYADDLSAEHTGINVDFSTATDQELVDAINAIRAEQRRRLNTKIILSDESIRIAVGESASISASIEDVPDGIIASSFSWNSSAEEVATCYKGRIKAVSKGTSTIICSSTLSDGTIVDSICLVEVYVPVKSISVSSKKLTVNKKQSALQDIKIEPENANDKSYSLESSNPDVVLIENDKATAVGVGSAIITITAKDGSNVSTQYQVDVPNLNLSKLQAGSKVYFGRFEQDNDTENGPERIRWLVLSREGNKALLISDMILDVRQFHASSGSAFWGQSDLRRWLNNDFLTEAFSRDEQNTIVSTSNKSINTINGKDSESYSTERVFVLSRGEAYKYFGNFYDRYKPGFRVNATAYAMARQTEGAQKMGLKSKKPFDEDEIRWWMRDCIKKKDIYNNMFQVLLASYSYTYFDTSEVLSDYYLGGVRPALWVDLKKADLFIESFS